MFTLRRISLLLFGLILVGGNAWAATLGFQGDVKGPDRKPVKGAEVRIQLKGAKAPAGSVKTDQQGRFIFKNLAVGEYSLSVSANGMATATVENLKTHPAGAVQVNFELKKQIGSAQVAPAKVKKQRVWVQELGSNMGHWEEVDEQGRAPSGPGARNVYRGGADSVRAMQDKTSGAMSGP